jgi:hypothetical protein
LDTLTRTPAWLSKICPPPSPAGSALAVAREKYATAPRAELVSIAGGRHDAFNDIMHRTVAATVILFLERLRNGAGLAPIAVREPFGHPVGGGES